MTTELTPALTPTLTRGIEAVMQRARADFARGEFRWVAQVASQLVLRLRQQHKVSSTRTLTSSSPLVDLSS